MCPSQDRIRGEFPYEPPAQQRLLGHSRAAEELWPLTIVPPLPSLWENLDQVQKCVIRVASILCGQEALDSWNSSFGHLGQMVVNPNANEEHRDSMLFSAWPG